MLKILELVAAIAIWILVAAYCGIGTAIVASAIVYYINKIERLEDEFENRRKG